ncbi:MAG: nitroreductase family protein [Clostridiales bacterium]|nr:nitroreductase family protein [Clostridiales bacterium]
MGFCELVLKRRSVRQYTGEGIPAERIRQILEAGLRAPNACNAQLWHFYVLIGADKVGGLIPDVCRQEWIKKTAFVVVITENSDPLNDRFGGAKGDLFVAEDAGAAAENMSLMAAELGYASCFVGAFDEDKCRGYIGAKPEERPVLMLPVGVPAAEAPLRDRKPFEESVTFISDQE